MTTYYALQLSWNDSLTFPDPSKNGFKTKEEAWDYVFDNMCKTCQEERTHALFLIQHPELKTDSEHDQYDSTHPACACEWSVGEDDGTMFDADGKLLDE